jgi:hypothetical protein
MSEGITTQEDGQKKKRRGAWFLAWDDAIGQGGPFFVAKFFEDVLRRPYCASQVHSEYIHH